MSRPREPGASRLDEYGRQKPVLHDGCEARSHQERGQSEDREASPCHGGGGQSRPRGANQGSHSETGPPADPTHE